MKKILTFTKIRDIIVAVRKQKPYRLQKGENMEEMKEFVAYARKLLRVINKIEKYLENGESEKALELVRELKEDTQKDIEA